MHLSDKGLMALISHEGIVQSRYKDSVGVWTIGVGHTAMAGGIDPAKFAGTLTMKEVFDLLRVDVAKYEAAVNRTVKVPVKQHQFDALVSFHYNTGAIGKATLVKRLNAGDIAGAGDGFNNWLKPKEITDRREAEQELFRTGKYPAPFATVYPATPQGKVLWKQGRRIDLAKALFIETAKPVEAVKPVETRTEVQLPAPWLHPDADPAISGETPKPAPAKMNWLKLIWAALAAMFVRK